MKLAIFKIEERLYLVGELCQEFGLVSHFTYWLFQGSL